MMIYTIKFDGRSLESTDKHALRKMIVVMNKDVESTVQVTHSNGSSSIYYFFSVASLLTFLQMDLE